MNVLVSYGRAREYLSNALSSQQVNVVLKGRADLNHIKLHAKQVRDRALLADATEYQLRVERWLGVLLGRAQEAGHLRRRGAASNKAQATTLREIGVDHKLSMKAHRAAALDQETFDAMITDVRSRLMSTKARPVNDIKQFDRRMKRASHAANYSAFDVLLADGSTVGGHRLGTLASLARRFERSHRILKSIIEHVGPEADRLATVRELLSAEMLNKIISSF